MTVAYELIYRFVGFLIMLAVAFVLDAWIRRH